MARRLTLAAVACAAALAVGCASTPAKDKAPGAKAKAEAAPDPAAWKLPAKDMPNAELVELGRKLFFDVRLSGDASMSCGTCHQPDKGFTDGRQLSKAYPGSEYFRNTKTILNASYGRYFYWDGRLSGKDLGTMVRDHITESHFLNMDGRLMLERLKQVPEYVERFNAVFGGEPSFGRTLKAVGTFVDAARSANVPFDQGRLSEPAQRGWAVFAGKGRCASCHNGPMFSDYLPHNLGVADHEKLATDPTHQFTLRSFLRFMGVPGFETSLSDPGFYVVSKEERHRGAFVTPSLRELKYTAPYLHNGTAATLAEVVDHHAEGGGELQPVALTDAEKADLVAFLESLSGDPTTVTVPASLPEYAEIEDWRSKEN